MRRSSRSGKGSSSASVPSARTRPGASRSATTTARNPWPTTSGREVAWLGAASSPALVRAPEGNGCAERFIRTLKENLLWVRTFATLEELRLALLEFRDLYNEHWLIERHGHRSPAQFRRDQMDHVPLAA